MSAPLFPWLSAQQQQQNSPFGGGAQSFDTSHTPFQFGGQTFPPGGMAPTEPVQEPPPNAGWDQPIGQQNSLIPELQQADILPPGGPDQTPGFLDFLRQQDPSEVGLNAAILARSFTNHGEAMQWAMRLQENRAQRAHQAQQNDLQRQARTDQIKEQTRLGKDRKDQADFTSAYNQTQAQAITNDYDLTADTAQFGDPADIAGVRARQGRISAHTSLREGEKKAAAEKNKILAQALKSEVKAPQYTQEKSPRYDPVFAENLAAVNRMRAIHEGRSAERHSQMTKLNEIRAVVAGHRARLLAAARTDQEKQNLEVIIKEANAYFQLAKQAMGAADELRVYGDDWEKAGQIVKEKDAQFMELLGLSFGRFDEIRQRLNLKPVVLPETTAYDDEEMGEEVPTEGEEQPSEVPAGTPTEQMKRGFRNAPDRPKARRDWRAQFPGVPFPE